MEEWVLNYFRDICNPPCPIIDINTQANLLWITNLIIDEKINKELTRKLGKEEVTKVFFYGLV